MIFVTGADWRFLDEVQEWRYAIEMWGYKTAVYDLGNLSVCDAIRGFEVKDHNFKLRGWFNCIGGGWFSTGMWKPKVILDAMERFKDEDYIIYNDADTRLQQPINNRFDFDIGVVRREEDRNNMDKNSMKVFLRGNHNAGVIFFRNCPEVKEFVREWEVMKEKYQNDQAGLHMMLMNTELNVKVFPETFNQKTLKRNTVILHVTGGIKNGKVYRATDQIC